MPTVPSGLKATVAPLVLCALSACASQSAAQRAPNGISVVIDDGGKCRSEGPAAAGSAFVPDADLCKGLVTSLKGELVRAGFTVVDQASAPRGLTLHLAAVQRAPT